MFDWDRFKKGEIKVILRTKQLAKDFYKECKKRDITFSKHDGEEIYWVEGGVYYKYARCNLVWGSLVTAPKDEVIEWEGIKGVKELTFKEVIANIKENEVWECTRKNARVKKIRMNNDLLVFDYGDTITEKQSAIRGTDTFKLQRKEYTFEEAFKALEEGKEIESCEECKIKLTDKDNALITDCAGDEIEYSNKTELFSIKEIKGKWYIND
ncbi:hypothetical protein [Clostridium sp.]|uniref:hypothetical protein n=1 Tax=Clostridium sp. TaxID=1506 RepID=UPI001D1AE426|nr:hypothetical protein [Clostridium sp.]MBS5937139.1 hypothetical protein [Clostridium sp.]